MAAIPSLTTKIRIEHCRHIWSRWDGAYLARRCRGRAEPVSRAKCVSPSSVWFSLKSARSGMRPKAIFAPRYPPGSLTIGPKVAAEGPW